jgi:hypothetical protein
MVARFSRSWSLVKASGAVLRQDKELLVFPLCAAIASLLIAVSFIVPLFGTLQRMDEGTHDSSGLMVLGFAFYLSQYFVVFFFNAALVGAAMIRLDGGDPTVADGLRIAQSKLVPILGYAAIAATVGLVLRIIEQRAGFIGRWITGLLGLAFTVATFLTVPLLVTRDVGPVEAVRESALLLKKTWGENIIGNSGMGLIFFLFYLALFAAGFLVIFIAAQTGNAVLISAVVGLCVLAAVGLALVHTALQGVYSAALYRYASDGEARGPFAGALLSDAFLLKA